MEVLNRPSGNTNSAYYSYNYPIKTKLLENFTVIFRKKILDTRKTVKQGKILRSYLLCMYGYGYYLS